MVYAWAADGTVIEGQTAASLTVTADMVGKKLSVTVTGDEESKATAETAPVEAEASADLEITEAKQTGSAAVKISLNKAIDGTAKIEVKRGNTAQTVTPTIAADGLSAVLTLGTAIGAAEYTITVTPADTTQKAATTTFTGEVSKLQSLAFKSENLVLTDANGKACSVMISGKDQFEGDVKLTKSNLKIYSSISTDIDFDNETQTITVKQPTTSYVFTAGTKITVTAIYQNGSDMIQEAKELTVAAQAYVADVEFGELTTTNSKLVGKTVTLKNFKDDSYYLPIITVKDQYDNDLTTKQLTTMKSAGTLFVMPTEDMDSYYAKFNGFETLDDGTKALKLADGGLGKPGVFQVSLTSVGGVNKSTSVEIQDDPYIDELSVTFPELYAGTAVEVTVTAKDQYGNAVDLYEMFTKTDAYTTGSTAKKILFGDTNHLSSIHSSVEVNSTSGGTFEYVKDVSKKTMTLKYTPSAADVQNGVQCTVSSAKPTINVQTLAINASGYVAGIKGLKASVATTLVDGESISFKDGKIQFLDNYGATMADYKLASDNTPEFKAATNSYDTGAVVKGNLTTTGTAPNGYQDAFYYITAPASTDLAAGYTSTQFDGTFKAGAVTTSKTLKVTIHVVPVQAKQTGSGYEYGSEITKDITVTVVPKNDITYGLEVVNGRTLHVGSTVDANISSPSVTVKLVGTSSSGKSVQVDQADLTELLAPGLTVTKNTTDGTYKLTGGKDIAAAGTVELKATVKGVDTRVTGTVNVDVAASVAEKAVFTDNTPKEVSPNITTGKTLNVNSACASTGGAANNYWAYIVDQYGDIMVNSDLKGVQSGAPITDSSDWTYNKAPTALQNSSVRLQNGTVELVIAGSGTDGQNVTIQGAKSTVTVASITMPVNGGNSQTQIKNGVDGTSWSTGFVLKASDGTTLSTPSWTVKDPSNTDVDPVTGLIATGSNNKPANLSTVANYLTPGTYTIIGKDGAGDATGSATTTFKVVAADLAPADLTTNGANAVAGEAITSGTSVIKKLAASGTQIGDLTQSVGGVATSGLYTISLGTGANLNKITINSTVTAAEQANKVVGYITVTANHMIAGTLYVPIVVGTVSSGQPTAYKFGTPATTVPTIDSTGTGA